MIEIAPSQVTPRFAALFEAEMPAALRCFAVLDGGAAGNLLTDDPGDPTWGAVCDAGGPGLYLGGHLDAARIAEVIAYLRRARDVLVGMWPDDPRLALLPPRPDYDGWTLEFTTHTAGPGFAALPQTPPPGTELRRLDADLLPRCVDRDYYADIFGGDALALERGFGRCLVETGSGAILCEAFAGPTARGQVELSVATRERDRRRGYATLTCARLIRDCQEAGLRPYWNCARQNLASAGLARKLGFDGERVYRLLAWLK